MFRKTLAALGVAAALTLIPTTAHALDCTNASRPAYTGTDYMAVPAGPGETLHVHLNGNWAYVLEFGAWVFVPPGTVPLTPGADGNFQNGSGFALLFNAICDSSGAVLEHRQTEAGIQLMSQCELEGP